MVHSPCTSSFSLRAQVSTQEQVQDLRQSIIEQPDTFQYSCFHLEHNNESINDYIELSEVKGLEADSVVRLVEDPYSEKEARMHTIRVRDLIGASGDRVDTAMGFAAGETLLDTVVPVDSAVSTGTDGTTAKSNAHPVAEYDFDSPPAVDTILPCPQDAAPKTVKSLVISPWNPPPHHLRQVGHLLYLLLTTNEGEQFQITGSVSGFHVNKSSNTKFDPMPKPPPKNASAHSLLTLISKLSPSFDASFIALQEYNGRRDPLVNFQITNTVPANPWLVAPASIATTAHQPDLTRSQEAYLLAGLENTDTLRDWNEEFQSTRELPRESVQDRVFRERIMSKLFADYNEAAIRGAMLCARGEIAPLNPTEQAMAQIFVYNNIFFSFGADGVGTFTSEGGDPAARMAVGKDVAGVKLVNQLDIEGLFTPGTVIVDYIGKRIVCQSLVPGIFKQRQPDEPQVNYGGVEGRDVVAADEAFVSVFSKLSYAFRIKRHPVWDKEGKRHDLEGSIETKGMLGTDGRKYVLDLYRLSPLDINWIEKHWCDVAEGETKPVERDYPHRMSVLRPELIESYWRLKMTEYVNDEVRRRQALKAETSEDAKEAKPNGTVEPEGQSDETKTGEATESKGAEDRVDISKFSFTFNPDVCCGQAPQTDAEKEELHQDERRVRDASDYLATTVIPDFVKDLNEGDVGFPMDGASLSRLLHKRGINVRYLGKIAELAGSKGPRLAALAALATQEMIARAFKHIASRFLLLLPPVSATTCLTHLLNCLLGTGKNKAPKAAVDEDLQSLYPKHDWSFAKITPTALQRQIEDEVRIRYRAPLPSNWYDHLKHLQLLREISLKLGLQLAAKEFQFTEASTLKTNGAANGSEGAVVNGNGISKKKKKNGEHKLDQSSQESLAPVAQTTFVPSDIVNILPVVKDSAPKSTLAEEALEAGRISLAQNQKELGQDLLLESLSLHEQIYGVLHPEVARVYHQLSMLYYQLDIKDAAAELARKAVILSERTLGVDHNETVLSYLNLGLFEHANGRTSAALYYIQHALELWKIVYGLHHPDSITTLNNAAVMLQSLKQYHVSRLWFEKSLALSTQISGPDAVATGTLAFQLAQALALDHDAHAAVTRMREAYAIFLAKLGPTDRSTKEAESWLEQLTQNAVSVAKHAKDVQARRLRRVQMTPRVTLGMRPQPAVGQSSADVGAGSSAVSSAAAAGAGSAGVSIDSRSVDELIRFIEGGGEAAASGSKSKKRSGKTHPKKRTAAKAS